MRMQKIVFAVLLMLVAVSGCQFAGFVSLLGTPSYHEAVVEAEFDLSEHLDKKILVLVEQPAFLYNASNFRFYLTEALDNYLLKRIEVPEENLVPYKDVAEFRAGEENYADLSAAEVGRKLGADLVLLVTISDCVLTDEGEDDYLSGRLETLAAVLDAHSGEQLWPAEGGTAVKVGFELETRGRDIAVVRLAAASAHCTARFLYDCPKKSFRIGDDRGGVAWENWGN